MMLLAIRHGRHAPSLGGTQLPRPGCTRASGLGGPTLLSVLLARICSWAQGWPSSPCTFVRLPLRGAHMRNTSRAMRFVPWVWDSDGWGLYGIVRILLGGARRRRRMEPPGVLQEHGAYAAYSRDHTARAPLLTLERRGWSRGPTGGTIVMSLGIYSVEHALRGWAWRWCSPPSWPSGRGSAAASNP